MIGQVYDNLRKSTETTIEFQREVCRQWSRMFEPIAGVVMPTSPPSTSGDLVASVARAREIQMDLASKVTDMLRRHKETLDAQYEAGVRAIEDAIRVADARDPAQLRRLTEGLWRHGFEGLRTIIEEQMREVRAMNEAIVATVVKGVTPVARA